DGLQSLDRSPFPILLLATGPVTVPHGRASGEAVSLTGETTRRQKARRNCEKQHGRQKRFARGRREYMKEVNADTSGGRAGALAGALLTAIFLAEPASAATASKNTNVTATAKYSASSEWDSASGDTTYLAGRAFDGDLTTRWNVDRGSDNQEGSWLEAD